MPDTSPPPSLAEIGRVGNLIIATCLSCWHQSVLEPRLLASACGAELTLEQLRKRLRCRCGSRRCHAGVRSGEMGRPAPAGSRFPYGTRR